MTFLLLILF